jgi:hypothetical protein
MARVPLASACLGLLILASGASLSRADEGGARGALELSIEVFAKEGGFHATAELTNIGANPLTFHLPEHHDAVPFPEWTVTGAGGAVVTPYAHPFQSMWVTGDQGTLVTLAPGKSWTIRRTYDLFVAAGPDGAGGLTPLPLDAGVWTVSCRYVKEDATIPVGGPNFSTTRRAVAGLWTGTAAAAPRTVTVRQAPVVSLRIDAPRDHVPGAPYPLTVTVRNDTGKLASLPGVLTIRASSKPNGSFVARVILGEAVRAAGPGETQTLGLGVGAVRLYTVDLAALTWEGGRGGAEPGALADALGRGIFALDASFAHPDHAQRLDSNGLWRYVAPRTGASAR